MIKRLRTWACAVKRDTIALYLAARDVRVAWYVKLLAACVAAYALSPIDLIPDFIPILGYLDDLILVPLGIWLAVRLIPAAIMAEHRSTAAALASKPFSRGGQIAIVVVWALLGLAAFWFAYGHFTAR